MSDQNNVSVINGTGGLVAGTITGGLLNPTRGVCPGCGRCNHCGHPYPEPLQPYNPPYMPNYPNYGQPQITYMSGQQNCADKGVIALNASETR